MTAEQFVWAWVKSQFLMPKKILFVPENLYYEAMRNAIEAHEKGLPAVQDKKKKKRRRARRQRNGENRQKKPERKIRNQESARR